MVDLTTVLEAATRARWDHARPAFAPTWDELRPDLRARLREDLLPAVKAAADATEALVRADIASQNDQAWDHLLTAPDNPTHD